MDDGGTDGKAMLAPPPHFTHSYQLISPRIAVAKKRQEIPLKGVWIRGKREGVNFMRQGM